jgi:hypothetical protein
MFEVAHETLCAELLFVIYWFLSLNTSGPAGCQGLTGFVVQVLFVSAGGGEG